MSAIRHFLSKLKVLKFFILPALGLALEIHLWKRQGVLTRIIYCSALAMLFAFCLIWLESRRRAPRQRRRRHHQDDFR